MTKNVKEFTIIRIYTISSYPPMISNVFSILKKFHDFISFEKISIKGPIETNFSVSVNNCVISKCLYYTLHGLIYDICYILPSCIIIDILTEESL